MKFFNFLNKYASDRILAYVDPMNAYYDNQKYYDKLGIDLSYFGTYLDPIVLASKIVDLPNTRQIISNIPKYQPFDKYLFSSLIYKFRSKLSHELCSISAIWPDEQTIDGPFYSVISDLSFER